MSDPNSTRESQANALRREVHAAANQAGVDSIDGRLLDPYGHFNFRVEIEGLDAGAFSSVEGLSMTIDEIEYQDGVHLLPRKRPGRKKYGNLKLKKGFVNKSTLFKWMLDTMGGKFQRKSGSIILLSDAGQGSQPVMRYNFFDAWPKSWSGIRFDGNSQGVQVEEVELVIERLEMQAG